MKLHKKYLQKSILLSLKSRPFDSLNHEYSPAAKISATFWLFRRKKSFEAEKKNSDGQEIKKCDKEKHSEKEKRNGNNKRKGKGWFTHARL